MTKKPNKGHGEKMLNLMNTHDLFVVDTLFKPKKKMWKGKYRRCNVTYMPKDETRHPHGGQQNSTTFEYRIVGNPW